MKLTGKQLEEIYRALLEAFDRESLEIMLRLRLDKSLEQISGTGNLSTVVFDLVRAAERGGWLSQLLAEAHDWVPGNERLAAVAQGLQPGPPAARPDLATSPTHTGTTSTALPRVDPDNPPYAALRSLLAASFNPQSLYRFCQERPAFRPVLSSLGPGHGLDDMIDRVLDHCRMYLLWDELLAGVAQVNRDQVNRFAAQLGGG